MKDTMVSEVAKFQKLRNKAIKQDADYHTINYMLERQRKEAMRKAKHDNDKKYYEAKAHKEADDDEEGSDSTDTSTV